MKKIKVNDCEEVLSSMRLIIENIEQIIEGNQVFVMGAGRSGLVAKAFAMRLMHLGLSVYVVGETTTPAVLPQDIVIAISGSGETRTITDLGKLAKDIGSILKQLHLKKILHRVEFPIML
jgi:6-phospho-3-hexuloisomerase